MNWFVSEDKQVYPCETEDEGEFELAANGPFETIEDAIVFAESREFNLCSNCQQFKIIEGESCPGCNFNHRMEANRWLN